MALVPCGTFSMKGTFRAMDAQPGYEALPRPFPRARMGNSRMLLEAAFIALAAISIWAIYQFVPARERQPTAPSETAQAIRGLQSSQLHVIDQVNALQEAASSGQAETKRLSDEITALNGKLEALQQSFASAQQAQPQQAQSPRRRRGRR
jgi:peptidoglycan hydrolase CwlO-like protein